MIARMMLATELLPLVPVMPNIRILSLGFW